MATILDKIFENKREAVEAAVKKKPLRELKVKIEDQAPPRDALSALQGGDGTRIIAEIKRRTPFKGDLVQDFDPQAIARSYAENGAAALSILTESRHFGGQLDYLEQTTSWLEAPVLRKDFLFCEYQVYESRAFGADFFLLIATALEKNQIADLMALGAELGMQTLVESHDEWDLEKAIKAGAGLMGINNRDLTSGKTDLDICRRLLKMVESVDGLTLVCESGIRGREDIEMFEKLGVHAFLIGESLMRAPSIPEKMKELLGHGNRAAG